MTYKKNDIKLLSIIHPVCCELDVHKGKIAAYLIKKGTSGEEYNISEFGTFTDELIEMREWLLENNCPSCKILSCLFLYS